MVPNTWASRFGSQNFFFLSSLILLVIPPSLTVFVLFWVVLVKYTQHNIIILPIHKCAIQAWTGCTGLYVAVTPPRPWLLSGPPLPVRRWSPPP